MNEDFIHLPEAKEIKDMLIETRRNIEEETKDNPEMKSESKLLTLVIETIEEKMGKEKDLNKLNMKDKIHIAAHLSFLESLMEDFFLSEEDLEDFDEDELDTDEYDEDLEEEEEEFEDLNGFRETPDEK